MKEKGLLVVMSGPSGAGKGTIVNKIMELKDDVMLSISCTTRKPRNGEAHGINYFFISHEEFDERIASDGFLEHAEFVGNKYGTPKDKVLKSLDKGKDIILEIEVQGAEKIRKSHDGAVLIFIAPPSLEELSNRLIKRGTENKSESKARLSKAKHELGLVPNYDYIVVNDDVKVAAKKVIDIISAEKCKVVRNMNLQNLLIKGEKV
jgi:guanylate kinase